MPRLTHTLEMRYIYRQEHPTRGIRGWQVSYKRGLKKQIHCYFGDLAYGGKEEALAAAKAFRDQLRARYDPDEPKTPQKARRVLRVENKLTELIGIRIAKAIRKSTPLPSYSWSGYAYVDGKLIHRAWTISKWGYETAFWNAAKHRQSLTGQPLPGAVPEPTPEILEWAKSMAEIGIDIFSTATTCHLRSAQSGRGPRTPDKKNAANDH